MSELSLKPGLSLGGYPQRPESSLGEFETAIIVLFLMCLPYLHAQPEDLAVRSSVDGNILGRGLHGQVTGFCKYRLVLRIATQTIQVGVGGDLAWGVETAIDRSVKPF